MIYILYKQKQKIYFLQSLACDRNSYPTQCYLTQAVMCALFIGCIETHAHGRQVKRIHYLFEGGICKSVPRDHRLTSLGKPRDAKR